LAVLGYIGTMQFIPRDYTMQHLALDDSMMQHTVAAKVSCAGVALHAGDMVNMEIHPAPENTGIVFVRSDVDDVHATVPAMYHHVTETKLGTTIANAQGVTVSTIEHVMAALWGYGIDNAVIRLDGPEVPIMDGSSEPFTFLLECTGRVRQNATRRKLELLKTVTVQDGSSMAIASPSDDFVLDITINFAHPMITEQRATYDFSETNFKQTISRARTFGFARDVEKMRSMGLALGGSLHNAIVLGDHDIMNEGGLRYNDEFVRHKALDCLGDYFLAGAQLLAHVATSRPGHCINNKLLRAIFADVSNYRIVGGEEVVMAGERTIMEAAPARIMQA
jgi:UDP-3-O-[3-hydroxymyristoyl] N-acetylglucosamine deacetylase